MTSDNLSSNLPDKLPERADRLPQVQSISSAPYAVETSDVEPTILLGDVEINVNAFMTDENVGPPYFSTEDVCWLFFARNAGWLRWQEKSGNLQLDGKPIRGKLRHGSKTRVYSLADIERLAHALAQHGVLPGERLRATLKVVQSVGRLWQVL